MPILICAASGVFAGGLPARGATDGTLRPPAVPLVACDPYFSIWSAADSLAETYTTHWTGKPNRISSQVSVDGKVFRVMGLQPETAPALAQKSVEVLPTRTIYVFEDAGVRLTLTFLTPALPDDIALLSRPVTYVTYAFQSLDGRTHGVAIQFDASGDITVNEPSKQLVAGSVSKIGGLTTLRLGSKEQPVLKRSGDGICIDWGYLYVAADAGAATGALTTGWDYRNAFGTADAAATRLNGAAKTRLNGAVPGEEAFANLRFAPFKVGADVQSRTVILAYDDVYSIQYLGKNLRPYWRRDGWEAADLLQHSFSEYEALRGRCEAFDAELMADLTRAGGEKYARICALAYRQCFAAGKFAADENGQPLQFSKENHSNGCIGTSDIFYPMSPLFLLNGPSLAKSFIVPFMNYAESARWKFPFAPHDIGQYPLANGQVYGGGEKTTDRQMPVEESGNLLILFGAIAQMEGNAEFAGLYWPTLEKWARYLKEKGFDPENQLCTDDFAGHLAHNANLSAKAIVALGSFAKLCGMRGEKAKADEYAKTARDFARRWMEEADDGDHYRLAFDAPGTWSQKYNLVWDRILGLGLFPPEVARKEMDFYLKNQFDYGLPLDNRRFYTKLDWITWTATLTQDRSDFEALVDPIFAFLNKTEQRAPMTDWYRTKDAAKVAFTARPVVGGVFLRMLHDRDAWRKYASRDKTNAHDWAPLPKGHMSVKAERKNDRNAGKKPGKKPGKKEGKKEGNKK
ncbi:MAG: DUF4965 domain-containing protein [Opitutaceae bacterium]|nr:DUF4965 domain-containing protein [Opitutaceae bacterium]